MTAYVSLIFAIIGLLMYLLATQNKKIESLGLVTYGVSLWVFLLQLSPKIIDIFGK